MDDGHTVQNFLWKLRFTSLLAAIVAHTMPQEVESLNIENALWANTVLAAGTAIGLVVYTGN
jgi:hypothetical protein